MNHPVDKQTFAELKSIRDRIVSENPKPDRIGIASPFVPWIGNDILEGLPGIYFVGIVTSGSCKEIKDYETALKFAKECAIEISSPFWRYIREVTKNVYDRDYSECISRIGWSNQFKIGVFDLNGETSCDPKGFYSKSQIKLCESILRRELRVARACAMVFLGDGPLIDPVLGEDNWDKTQFREQGMWKKSRPNGGPIFYQYHPGYLLRQGKHHFDENARILALALREWLAEPL